MKKFQEPEIQVMSFMAEDIVTTSTDETLPQLINDCLS